MLTLFLALAVLQPPDGAAVYADHCATCHAGNDSRTPPVAVLRQKAADEILAALVSGRMREQGSGLSDAERRAVAEYLGVRPSQASGGTPAPRTQPGGTDAGRCAAVPAFDPSSGPSWTAWSPDAGNTRYQPRPGLGADQLSKLTLKWAFGFPNATSARVSVDRSGEAWSARSSPGPTNP